MRNFYKLKINIYRSEKREKKNAQFPAQSNAICTALID